jgi:ketosteroid isomerase-like protein
MNKKTIYDFASAINEHSTDKMYSLMTDDHKFIDAHGNAVVGKDQMKIDWKNYFQRFPDYKIEITNIFANGEFLGAFGFESGAFKGQQSDNWPASWKVIVDNNKIKLWQVYEDTEIQFETNNETGLIKIPSV